jgi:hypothetical protein
MMNGTLQDFVSAVSAKGQIRYGDVRRLQRDILRNGILAREEAELLIAVNARLNCADKAWAQWLVAAVTEFVTNKQEGEHPLGGTFGGWIGRLIAASSTRFGRRIEQKLQRALAAQHDAQSTDAGMPDSKSTTRCDLARPRQGRAPKAIRDKRSPRRSKPRCAVGHKANQSATPLAAAGFGRSLPGYLPAIRHGHVMNFPSVPVGLVLALCR